MRIAEKNRKTAETDIRLQLNLDGKGTGNVRTGCGFLDHMLTLFTRHARIDLTVDCTGDVQVDYHHTVEDIGITLGQAFKEALGDKRGVVRYGDTTLPMDETLILSAVDISGRGGCFYSVPDLQEKVGDMDTELVEEFWIAFARESGITLHVRKLDGKNTHHILEGIFKSVARSLRKAMEIDEVFGDEIPSTKGVL